MLTLWLRKGDGLDGLDAKALCLEAEAQDLEATNKASKGRPGRRGKRGREAWGREALGASSLGNPGKVRSTGSILKNGPNLQVMALRFVLSLEDSQNRDSKSIQKPWMKSYEIHQ